MDDLILCCYVVSVTINIQMFILIYFVLICADVLNFVSMLVMKVFNVMGKPYFEKGGKEWRLWMDFSYKPYVKMIIRSRDTDSGSYM